MAKRKTSDLSYFKEVLEQYDKAKAYPQEIEEHMDIDLKIAGGAVAFIMLALVLGLYALLEMTTLNGVVGSILLVAGSILTLIIVISMNISKSRLNFDLREQYLKQAAFIEENYPEVVKFWKDGEF